MKLQKESNGFTLVEVLIALVILAISLLGLASLMAKTTEFNASGSHATEGSLLAQDRLEFLRGSQWASIDSNNANPYTITGSNGILYTCIWTVSTPSADILKAVTITVSWTDKISHSLTFGPYTIMKPPGQ